MIEYRRGVGSQVWHWREDCRDYPTSAFEIALIEPQTRALCPHCGAASGEPINVKVARSLPQKKLSLS